MINREIIGGRLGLIYDDHSRKDVFLEIDRVKTLLSNAGVRKGDLVTIAIIIVDITHIASIFACAELGLRILS